MPAALPRHLAIIMDGNGRWAKEKGLQRVDGHKAGAQAVRTIVTYCRELGIRYLTLYAFSSENWNRPASEISALFMLLLDFLRKETPLMVENGIALNVIGDVSGLPVPQRLALNHSMSKTGAGDQMTLNLALNYGARSEIVYAVKNIIKSGIPPESITEQIISEHLYTKDQPDPDLIIRTSGEMRLSNYLLYQAAYSELYFTPVFWPDFDRNELNKALVDFANRDRRFGLTDEQIKMQD